MRLLRVGVGARRRRAPGACAIAVAASDSIARSASTFRISGCSLSALPKALRWRGVPGRLADAARASRRPRPITQSRRVWPTISMIVGTPRPSSPTIRAQAPWNSTSLEALERLPSLSFRRWMRNRVARAVGQDPRAAGSRRGPRRSARGRGTASHIGAEQNHLWPVISYSAPGPPPFSGTRVVVLARTSEPPCFSVIAMPAERAGPSRPPGVSSRVVRRGGEQRLPLGGELRLRAQRRDRPRRSSRSGSTNPASACIGEHEQRRARDVRAVAVGRATAARAARRSTPSAHQLVPGRVELDLVDAVAVAVVRAQHRRCARWPARPSA